MKRQGNLASFAFFGLLAQTVVLLLLGQGFSGQEVSFLFAALVFVFYRAYIGQEKKEQESYLKREMRRWWLRQEPENTFTFALIGGLLLTLSNVGLWQVVKPVEIWAMSFVAIGLTQIAFESGRNLLNAFIAYLKVRWKFVKLMEVKRFG